MAKQSERVGENHHRAVLTDQEVEEIRQLHEEGWGGYGKIARKYDIGKSTVQDIVSFRRRPVPAPKRIVR